MPKHLFPELDKPEPPTTGALFPNELPPPSLEYEKSYSDAARALRKAGEEPTENLDLLEKRVKARKR